jgi:hypothetical protein
VILATPEGRLLVAATSGRTAASGWDLVVARLHGDSLFGSGFGD